MVAPVHRPQVESVTSRHRQFANFLSVASSILGGAILQVFLSPPAAVTADAADDPAAFGWCASLHACAAWQRAWQLSCVLAFCFVILSIIACATASVANKTSIALAAAILFFFASFFATAVAVLSIVFLSFPMATCIATAALLVGLLVSSALIGKDGLVMGLDDVVLGPRLWRAAAAGDAAAVRRLLSWGANPCWGGHVPRSPAHDANTKAYFLSDTGPIHGVTPLHIAACCGHLEVAQELLRKNPNIKLFATDSLGSSPLHVAAYSLDNKMLELLLSKKGNGWTVNNDGWTPLLAAMEVHSPNKPPPRAVQFEDEIWDQYLDELKMDAFEDPDPIARKTVAEQLLAFRSKGAINAISPKSQLTALQLAIKRNWKSIAHSLIDAGASADVPGTSHATLGLACVSSQLNVTENPGRSAMMRCLERIPIANLQELLDAGTLQNMLDFVNIKSDDMVHHLVDKGADVNWQGQEGKTALHVCIDLLSAAACKEAKIDSCFHILVGIFALLERGASVDVKNDVDAETPLMRAAQVPGALGSWLTTVLLLFSPNLDATDNLGNTALTCAIDARNEDTVALLLAAGANPNPPLPHVIALTKDYLTPLQLSIVAPSSGSARLLIKHGADVNAFPPVLPNETRLRAEAARQGVSYNVLGDVQIIHHKMPPLMHAIAESRPELVKLLLDNGADIWETGDAPFESSLHCAQEVGEIRIFNMLARHIRKQWKFARPGCRRWAKYRWCIRAAFAARRAAGHRRFARHNWRTRVAFATRRAAGMAANQGADEEADAPAGAAAPPVPQQAGQAAQYQAIDIPREVLAQQAQPPAEQSAPWLSMLATLAQVFGRLLQPFRRRRSGEPSPPLSPQPSQHRIPLSADASSSHSSLDKESA